MKPFFLYFGCLVGLFSPLSVVLAQSLKVTVSYTGVGPTQLPVWVAKEAGIFTRNGLDVELIRAGCDLRYGASVG